MWVLDVPHGEELVRNLQEENICGGEIYHGPFQSRSTVRVSFDPREGKKTVAGNEGA